MERQTVNTKPVPRSSAHLGTPPAQPEARPHIPLDQEPLRSFCTPAYAKAGAQALAGFLSLDKETDALEVNKAAQAERLFAWKPSGGDTRCMNSAWRVAPSTQKQAMTSQMPTLFPLVQPQLKQVPSVIVVPLGLHALNAVRIRALKDACAQLIQNFGPHALKSTHIYFVGGRNLMKEECQPIAQVMDAGLGFFCETQWSELDSDLKNGFLRHFAETQASELGDAGLQLTPVGDQPLREKDSARQIWVQAPGLAQLREVFDQDHVHFHEAKERVNGKDNTHGNARLVMDKCLSHRTLAPAQGHSVLVCSDVICLPRVEATFKGYFEPWGWEVMAFSASMTGADEHRRAEAHTVFCTLGLRETACYQNEHQEARQNAGSWFNSEDLKVKFAPPQ